eukprot:TRINITY_DN16828_c1_g7_i1.p1 TRINITY_DN16828_c1_g7~~TRINITY_DN16828_c1_g7_i1.p1  ORF type:complete len:406 (-),score=81.13 TRINITY_DN16828_c1_g7_i1:156-1373(-)
MIMTTPSEGPPGPKELMAAKLQKYASDGARALAGRPFSLVKASLDALDDNEAKQCLMGTTERQPLTGKIRLNDEIFPEFTLVDLWNRDRIDGTRESIAEDVYLFRPRPLLYRTWMYHYNYTTSKVMPPDHDDSAADIESRLIKYVLRQQVIDRNESLGRWSPVLVYFWIAFFACVSGDVFIMVVTLTITLFVYLLSTKLSFPPAYKVDRLASLPFRLAYIGIFFSRMPALFGLGAAGALGALAILGGLLIDFYVGDLRQLTSYKFTCKYEILAQLPSRVFVVRQHGGAQDYFRKSEKKWSQEQRIKTTGSLDRSVKLIADIEGVLFELDPIDIGLINQIAAEQEDKFMSKSNAYDHCYLGLDVFNEEAATVNEVQKLRQAMLEEKMALAEAKNRKQYLEAQHGGY